MPSQLVKTLTWDQGSEMAGHAAFSLATAVDVYFAHPHSPWERGTNENTNGLLREYFPKGTEITDDQAYLDLVARELNNRPRRILGYRTPAARVPHIWAVITADLPVLGVAGGGDGE
jgi:IS30 family transposase